MKLRITPQDVMSLNTDQLDAMIIEGENRIAEFEEQLREPRPEMDTARAMHILLLLYRSVNRLYVERISTPTDNHGYALNRETDREWLH